MVKPVTKTELEKEKLQKEKEKWLNEQKLRDVIREREKQKQKDRERHRDRDRDSKHRSSRDRSSRDRDRMEREDLYRDREREREAEKKFESYKPVVNLEYHDEFGNTLTPKEAFRQLSHKFHGKMPGKLKTEKRLKKLDEEKKLRQMSSTDTPLGTVSALQEKTRELGSAHVVLSVGNRGVMPNEQEPTNIQPRINSIPKKSDNNSKDIENSETTSSIHSGRSNFVNSLNGNGSDVVNNGPKREKIVFGLKRKAEQDINPVFKKSQ